MNALPFTLFAYAQQNVTSILASIINAATPIMTLLALLTIFRVEKLKLNVILGLLIGMGGVMIVHGTAGLIHLVDHLAPIGAGWKNQPSPHDWSPVQCSQHRLSALVEDWADYLGSGHRRAGSRSVTRAEQVHTIGHPGDGGIGGPTCAVSPKECLRHIRRQSRRHDHQPPSTGSHLVGKAAERGEILRPILVNLVEDQVRRQNPDRLGQEAAVHRCCDTHQMVHRGDQDGNLDQLPEDMRLLSNHPNGLGTKGGQLAVCVERQATEPVSFIIRSWFRHTAIGRLDAEPVG
jgi:hypothetical protein